MKKAWKVALLLFLIITGTGSLIILQMMGVFFNPGNLYEWEQLDYMDVPFENAADINAWSEGFSTSADCPWGHAHNGLDFLFNDSANVLSMAPGLVMSIVFRDNGEGNNRFTTQIFIRFNRDILLRYHFESWADTEVKGRNQLDNITVEVGDWVSAGDIIAEFVSYHVDARIHFDINIGMVNWEEVDPEPYFSESAHTKMMNLIHSYHPTWNMSYV